MLQWLFFGTLIRHGTDKLPLLSYNYAKPQQDHSWPNIHEQFWTGVGEKAPHVH
jgi:hypothetical protein